MVDFIPYQEIPKGAKLCYEHSSLLFNNGYITEVKSFIVHFPRFNRMQRRKLFIPASILPSYLSVWNALEQNFMGPGQELLMQIYSLPLCLTKIPLKCLSVYVEHGIKIL